MSPEVRIAPSYSSLSASSEVYCCAVCTECYPRTVYIHSSGAVRNKAFDYCSNGHGTCYMCVRKMMILQPSDLQLEWNCPLCRVEMSLAVPTRAPDVETTEEDLSYYAQEEHSPTSPGYVSIFPPGNLDAILATTPDGSSF